jgi:regulator of protease activity HflC (stomatin/prohibitin superfamily)
MTEHDIELGVSSMASQPKKLGCCGCCCLLSVVALIIFGCSVHQLGPEDQILIHNEQGKEVVNGPGTHLTDPFRKQDWRKATRLGPLEYALLENELTGIPRHVEGPALVWLDAYDTHVGTKAKIILQKDEYIILVEQVEGTERVVKGPKTFVPSPTETSPKGPQKVAFLDTDSAALILDKTTGMESLVQEQGIYVPNKYQEVLEIRNLIHVLPHEAVIEQDDKGRYTVHSGPSAFFIQPYHSLVTMDWSSYSDPIDPTKFSQEHKRAKITKIDMRARMMFFTYEVRTSDNVKLRLDGNIFWRITNVTRMVEISADPEGEVWQHARSGLIQGVSRTTLSDFMNRFNEISTAAFEAQATDGFYKERGVEIISMEVTRYEPMDSKTAEVLQAAKLASDIQLEKSRTELIETQSKNQQLQAQMQGESDGQKRARNAKAFIDGLETSVANVSKRVELYELQERLDNSLRNTEHISSSKATLFLTPQDMNLKLHMHNGGSYGPEL